MHSPEELMPDGVCVCVCLFVSLELDNKVSPAST